MRIGIIVAMDKELSLLLPMLEGHETKEGLGFYFHVGTIGRHEVVIMECGIGKVNAAISTMTLLESQKPDLVINTGVAGGADKSVNVMDVVVADAIAYHDVWCGPGTDYGQAAGMPLYFSPDARITGLLSYSGAIKKGLICSGDKFIDKMGSVDKIKKHFPEALAVDMESAAIAHVCHKMGVPMFCMRIISDSPGASHNNSQQYEDFWSEAPEQTFEIVRQLLESIK